MIAAIEDDISAFGEMNEDSQPNTTFRFSRRTTSQLSVSCDVGVFKKKSQELEPPATSNYTVYDMVSIAANRSNAFADLEFPAPQPPARVKVRESNVALQKWEGHVLEVLSKSFTARLVDLTNPGGKEDAEFSMMELADDDRSLLRRGAGFYWTIGRQVDTTNRARTVSEIRFQRLPIWTEDEISLASREAKEMADQFGIK
jgi:hypothetical protein